MVVSVDYRLFPAVKFPVPIDDCYAAYQWVRSYIKLLAFRFVNKVRHTSMQIVLVQIDDGSRCAAAQLVLNWPLQLHTS